MKKTLLALSVMGAWVNLVQAQTAPASSVTLYGLVDENVTYTNKVLLKGTNQTARLIQVNSGGIQGSRFGFRGSEDLGGGLRAIFQIEAGLSADTGAASSTFFGRKAVVGLGGGFGTVLLGRQVDYRDTMGYYTGVADFGGMVANIHDNDLDRTSGERVTNSIRYDSAKWAGFSTSIIYGLGEQAGDKSAGKSWGISGAYNDGPLSVALGNFQSNLGTTPSDQAQAFQGALTGPAGAVAVRSWMLGASYQAGPARLFGSFSTTKQPLAVQGAARRPTTTLPTGTQFTISGSNNKKTDVVDVGFNYLVTGGLAVVGAFEYARFEFIGASRGTLKQLNLGLDYAFSKRTDAYFHVAGIKATDMYNPGLTAAAPGGGNNPALVRIGIRHKF